MRSSLFVLTMCLVAACGDDGTNKLADAPPGVDARHIDAPLIDAPLAPVTLTVTLQGSAAAGAQVYFLNADSTVVLDTTTGSDGKASAVMAAGGSVTAIEPQVVEEGALPNGTATLDTFAGVKPGDDLHLDVDPQNPGETSIAFDVTVPTAANGTNYEFSSTCGGADLTPPAGLRKRTVNRRTHRFGDVGNEPPVNVTLFGCGATADILISAFDDSFNLVGTIYLPNQAVSDGTALVVAGPYVAPATQTVTLTNPSPTTNFYDFDADLISAKGFFFESDASAGSGSASIAIALAYPAAASVPNTTEGIFLDLEPNNTVSDEQALTVWGPTADAQTIDLSKLVLQDYGTAPQYDFSSQQIVWNPTPTGLAPDLLFGQIFVDRDFDEDDEATWTWTIAAPGSEAGTLQFPTLPTDVFNFTPQAQDSVQLRQLDTAQVPGGYDGVRANVFAENTLFFEPPAGTTGHVSITEREDVGLRAKAQQRAKHHVRKRTAMTRH